MSSASPIRNVSDTARWVAIYRAMESERPDALFHDPFARRLGGERGEAIAKAMGGSAEVEYNRGYPSTINSEREAIFAAKVGERVFGKNNVFTDAEPTMGGEDFSYMLQARPGAYVFLGQGGGPNNCFLHNPGYDFNDDVIPLGAGFLAALVEESLPLK